MNLATLDMTGAPGFGSQTGEGWEMSGTDYVLNFDGNSASAPQAAGVVALILSVNSNLGSGCAGAILEKSADEVGGYSYSVHNTNGFWDPQMGYGRINAANAVALAVASPGMTGPTYLCSGSAVYGVSVPSNITTTWSVSNADATLSCTICTSPTLTAVTKGLVTLTATFSNSCGALPLATLTKNIYIKENPVNVTGTPGACSGTTQTWALAATPASGSNWNWHITSGTGIFINSPGNSQTPVDVSGGDGGGITLTYTDLCSVSQQGSVKVYSECGGEEARIVNESDFIIAPNPANNTVKILQCSEALPAFHQKGVIGLRIA